MTEDETVGWHYRLNGHDFKQTAENSGGQGSLACCNPWGRKESDTTKQLNNSNKGKNVLGEEKKNLTMTDSLVCCSLWGCKESDTTE